MRLATAFLFVVLLASANAARADVLVGYSFDSDLLPTSGLLQPSGATFGNTPGGLHFFQTGSQLQFHPTPLNAPGAFGPATEYMSLTLNSPGSGQLLDLSKIAFSGRHVGAGRSVYLVLSAMVNGVEHFIPFTIDATDAYKATHTPTQVQAVINNVLTRNPLQSFAGVPGLFITEYGQQQSHFEFVGDLTGVPFAEEAELRFYVWDAVPGGIAPRAYFNHLRVEGVLTPEPVSLSVWTILGLGGAAFAMRRRRNALAA